MIAMSDPRDILGQADDADVAEQQRLVDEVDEDQLLDLPARGSDDADEGDLLEQSTPVPEDDDDHRD
jgi:hypothetical protein